MYTIYCSTGYYAEADLYNINSYITTTNLAAHE